MSWARSIQSTPQPSSWRDIVVWSPHLHLGHPSGLLSSGFPTKVPYALLLFPIHATCRAYLIRLDLVTRMTYAEKYRSWSSSLCRLLHSLLTSSLLGPNVFLDTLFSHTLSPRSSVILETRFDTRLIKSQHCISVYWSLYVLDSWLEDKRICTEW